VKAGETLPEIVKGPLTVTSIVAFVQGWGSLYVRAHGLAFDLFDRHPALGIPNAFGVPEPPERVHWDEALARAVGVPGAYDYGPERVAWLGHVVTNWMGDAGRLARLAVQVRRHNLIGDTTWCRGTVTGAAVVDGRGEATLALTAVNQRGEMVKTPPATTTRPPKSVRSKSWRFTRNPSRSSSRARSSKTALARGSLKRSRKTSSRECGKPGATPPWRAASQARRLAGSMSTAYASLISLKRSSARASPRLRSGCHCSARRR